MNTVGLFDSGWDFSKWTPLDWGMAVLLGFIGYTAYSALSLSVRRLR